MPNTAFYNDFQQTLEAGLIKIGNSTEVISGDRLLMSDDIMERWDALIKDYIAEAVEQFNDYPDSTIAWAGFVGMAVAHYWDEDWAAHCADSLESMYGERGWDDMDEHILRDILGLPLDSEDAKHIVGVMQSCAEAVQVLIRREGVQPQTEDGFFVLARSYTVMFRMGASMELQRLKYHYEPMNPA